MLNLYLAIRDYSKKHFKRIEEELFNIKETLSEITARLISIERKEDKFMADVASELELLRTSLDAATNAVAEKIQALTNSIKNSMTDAEVASIKSGFGAVVTRLNDLAADPTNPVPPEVSAPL